MTKFEYNGKEYDIYQSYSNYLETYGASIYCDDKLKFHGTGMKKMTDDELKKYGIETLQVLEILKKKL